MCGSSSLRVYEWIALPLSVVEYKACSKCVAAYKAMQVDKNLGDADALLAELKANIEELGINPKLLTSPLGSQPVDRLDAADAIGFAMKLYKAAHKP